MSSCGWDRRPRLRFKSYAAKSADYDCPSPQQTNSTERIAIVTTAYGGGTAREHFQIVQDFVADSDRAQ
jgi:hypothetical protein